MKTLRGNPGKSRVTAVALLATLLFLLTSVSASADVQPLQNAFNPRGFFVTLKSGGDSQWLRSAFQTGYYRSGDGGGGNGGGNGGASEKDELGHSNVTYTGVEAGLDYVDAEDVDTIYSTYDHNPSPGKDFMIGYYKDEQAGQLQAIPNFTQYIGTPGRGSSTVPDPAGGQWWNVPIQFEMEPGTLYEFAYLRGSMANNGTTCVLIPGETEGTYKGYMRFTGSETSEERRIYEAHKYDEYEFITGIDPAGSSGDNTVDHTIQTVPMRYRLQTFADLSDWYESAVYQEAEVLLASVTEADYENGQYNRDMMTALQNTLNRLNEEAEGTIKYQLQKDAEKQMEESVAELSDMLERAKASIVATNFENYNVALSAAEETYNSVKDNVGTNEGQYRSEPVEALKNAIDHAKSTITGTSTQTKVDTETATLNEARMNALDALITPTERIFQDSATGIIVRTPIAALPDTAQLAVREVVKPSNEYDAYVARITPTPDAAVVYRIEFVNGTEAVSPSESVTIQIPLQNTFEGMNPSVYYLDNMNSAGRNMNATAAGQYRVFTTAQMGTYALAGQKEQTTTQSTTQSTTQGTTRSGQNSTRTTQRTTQRTTRTTRILQTTRDPSQNQNQKNEMTTTSVQETQAMQPTTMTTVTTTPTTAIDTSNLEQEANPNTMMYIALLIAGIGIITLIYQLVKDGKENDDDEDAQL